MKYSMRRHCRSSSWPWKSKGCVNTVFSRCHRVTRYWSLSIQLMDAWCRRPKKMESSCLNAIASARTRLMTRTKTTTSVTCQRRLRFTTPYVLRGDPSKVVSFSCGKISVSRVPRGSMNHWTETRVPAALWICTEKFWISVEKWAALGDAREVFSAARIKTAICSPRWGPTFSRAKSSTTSRSKKWLLMLPEPLWLVPREV